MPADGAESPVDSDEGYPQQSEFQLAGSMTLMIAGRSSIFYYNGSARKTDIPSNSPSTPVSGEKLQKVLARRRTLARAVRFEAWIELSYQRQGKLATLGCRLIASTRFWWTAVPRSNARH